MLRGGGWRARGRENDVRSSKTKVGYNCVDSAIDAHSRRASSESLPNEQGPSCAELWNHANKFFGAHGITVEVVLTDNAENYLRKHFTAILLEIENPGRDVAEHRHLRAECARDPVHDSD
jgi:hypothetical protein